MEIQKIFNFFVEFIQFILFLLRDSRECIETRGESSLDVGGVKHDTDSSTEGLRRKVLLEVGTDETGVAVSSSNLAPDNSDLGSTDLLRSTVDKSNTLSKVELSFLRSSNTLDLNQGDVRVSNVLAALVGNVLSLNVDYMTSKLVSSQKKNEKKINLERLNS